VSNQQPVRVLIFDPSPVYAQGLKACLDGSADLCCIGSATTERDAKAAIDQKNATIVIVAAFMAHVDVPRFVRDILLKRPQVRLVALGDPGLDPFPTRLIRAGVSGYLLKDCDTVELKMALRAVSQGKTYIASPIASVLVDQIHRVGKTLSSGTYFQLDLTTREVEVLELVAIGYSNRAIAMALQVSERTVENHVQRVYRKLGVHDRSNAVLRALRHGFVPSLSAELWPDHNTREVQRSLAKQSHEGAEAQARTVG
jgi:two-component system response regulator DegU